MADPEKFVEWVTGQPMALVEATNSVFRASASHSVGLVPDPGASPDGLKALFNDGAFKAIATVTVPATTQYSFRPPTEIIFTTAGSQSYSYSAGTVALYVEVGGPGGPGGGVDGQGASTGGGGGGGGAGGFGKRLFTVASVSATVTIIVGTAGVVSSTTQPTDGSTSSFGIYIVASGGSAGQTVLAATDNFVAGVGGAAGGSTGGIINGGGTPGGNSNVYFNSAVTLALSFESGEGGSLVPYGSGGKARVAVATTNGVSGTGLGSGGGGGTVFSTNANVVGGAATDGFVYIMEIYSLSAT